MAVGYYQQVHQPPEEASAGEKGVGGGGWDGGKGGGWGGGD